MKSRIFIALLLIGFGCQHNPISINIKPPTLTVEDVNCTEVWLKISSSCANYDVITLKRDTTILDTLHLATADTTILDANLRPSHTYTYTLATVGATNITTQARTMDTTSHAFTWQSFTLGDGGDSYVLHDVAIINDTLAYAAGDIYMGGTMYNLARWNGQTWELQRIPYNYQGQPFYNSIQCIYTFGPNDIWIAGNGIQHWDGLKFNEINLPISIWGQNQINKIWGISSSDLYIVGNSGSIAHYNGANWTQISNGAISVDINDMWGMENISNNQTTILCTSSTIYYGGVENVLSLSGTTAVTTNTNGLPWSIRGIYFDSRCYYIVGDGIFYKHSLQDASWQNLVQGVTTNYVESIRGNASNDIIAAGDHGTILHFNGISWHNYTQQLNTSAAIFYASDIKGNIAITVGTLGDGSAIVMVGKRN